MLAVVYVVWWARNEAIWNGVVWKVEKIVMKLKYDVVARLHAVLPQKKFESIDNLWWVKIKHYTI